MGMSYRERKNGRLYLNAPSEVVPDKWLGSLPLTRNSGGPGVHVKRQSSRRTGHRAGK